MPSGGARVRSGPARDPMALRRGRKDDLAGFTFLPAEGRQGEPPAWPKSQQTEREAELWAEYWRYPQAVVWERERSYGLVALFVREYIKTEALKVSCETVKTVRQLFGDLYLTPDAMAKAKLRIVEDEVQGKREESEAPTRVRSRDRLRAVPDGSGA